MNSSKQGAGIFGIYIQAMNFSNISFVENKANILGGGFYFFEVSQVKINDC